LEVNGFTHTFSSEGKEKMSLLTSSFPQEVQVQCAKWRLDGNTIAFVPTMGALHEGHIELVRHARKSADKVVVSIFVNPLQFGPSEDFEKYPRTLSADFERLNSEKVDLIFTPNTASMYPSGFQTNVRNQKMTDILCGKIRPGHFDGVCTVVLKLFNIVQPHFGIFGKKDYQQLAIIKQMAKDLNHPVQVVGHDIIREESGLAMSSRNRYLSDQERSEAGLISKGLFEAQKAFTAGEKNAGKLTNIFLNVISAATQLSVEYCEVRTQEGLEKVEGGIDQPSVMLVALRLPTVRLIDNVELSQRA